MRNNPDQSIQQIAAESEAAALPPSDAMEIRLAQRLAALRTERGQSLEELALASGISRATLSRLERGETSPTASLLGKLCAVHGISMSRLLAGVEPQSASLVLQAVQTVWVDPQSGFQRRMVSPPSRDFKMEMVEITIPAGAVVSYEVPTVHGTEQQFWMLEGILELTLDDVQYRLQAGDCLRFHMHGAARFFCPGPEAARYVSLSCAP